MSGFVPDVIIIPDPCGKMLDDLRTFCEEIVNDGIQSPRAAGGPAPGMRKPPARAEGFHIFEKREREEIVWFCT